MAWKFGSEHLIHLIDQQENDEHSEAARKVRENFTWEEQNIREDK